MTSKEALSFLQDGWFAPIVLNMKFSVILSYINF
jgi:hypothetical protein